MAGADAPGRVGAGIRLRRRRLPREPPSQSLGPGPSDNDYPPGAAGPPQRPRLRAQQPGAGAGGHQPGHTRSGGRRHRKGSRPSPRTHRACLLEMAGFLRQQAWSYPQSRRIRTAGVESLNQGIAGIRHHLRPGRRSIQRLAALANLQPTERARSYFNLPRNHDGGDGRRLPDWLNFSNRAGLTWGSGDMRLRLGHAKIMLTLTTGKMGPDINALRGNWWRLPMAPASRLPSTRWSKRRSKPRHELLNRKLNQLEQAAAHSSHRRVLRDRIEHCAECPRLNLVELVRRSGAIGRDPAGIDLLARRRIQQKGRTVAAGSPISRGRPGAS